jgi:hypothetical protein
MTSTINNTKVNGTPVRETKKPATPRRKPVVVRPRAEVPPTSLADSAAAKVSTDAVQTFANAIAAVEVLAYNGSHELIMQIARIAYTRGRQVAREAGVDL